jgi:transposase-like protein
MRRVLESVMEASKEGLAAAKRPLRGSWTPTQKRQIVAESYAAGANVAEVAQRHAVRPALLASWRRQASRMATSSKKATKFAAVRVSTAPTEGVIEIDLAGGCVRVRGIVDAGMLREVLAAAR